MKKESNFPMQIVKHQYSKGMHKKATTQNEDELNLTNDFATKLSELAYEVSKSVKNKGELIIPSYNHLSCNLHKCWLLIKIIQSMGIKIVCLQQPINFRGAYAKCILAVHFTGYETE